MIGYVLGIAAAQDIREICTYIARDSVTAAERIRASPR